MPGPIRHDFDKLNRLPPYVLAEVIEMMKPARRALVTSMRALKT